MYLLKKTILNNNFPIFKYFFTTGEWFQKNVFVYQSVRNSNVNFKLCEKMIEIILIKKFFVCEPICALLPSLKFWIILFVNVSFVTWRDNYPENVTKQKQKTVESNSDVLRDSSLDLVFTRDSLIKMFNIQTNCFSNLFPQESKSFYKIIIGDCYTAQTLSNFNFLKAGVALIT
jgi:hypothetical protein